MQHRSSPRCSAAALTARCGACLYCRLDTQLKAYEEQKRAAGEAESAAAPEEGSTGANGSAAAVAPAANGAHTERPTNGAQEQGSPAYVVNTAATGGGGMVMEGGLA